jgi:uncharacterized protein (TIGR00251 family)
MNSACLREAQGGVYLSVKLQPRASRNQIQGLHGLELKIAVTAPPVDSAANSALIDFLAEKLNVSRSAVQIVRGQTSRHKTIFIANACVSDITHALNF